MEHYYSVASSGQNVTLCNWNEMTADIWCQGGISGSYRAHSGNRDIHFPSSQITSWFQSVSLRNGHWSHVPIRYYAESVHCCSVQCTQECVKGASWPTIAYIVGIQPRK